jgi:hypothetical protein
MTVRQDTARRTRHQKKAGMALPTQIDKTIIAAVVGIVIMFAAVLFNAFEETSVGIPLLIVGAIVLLLATIMHQLAAGTGKESSGHRAQR